MTNLTKKIIGKFTPIVNDGRKTFYVVSREFSDYLGPAWKGYKDDGEEYHVTEKAWHFDPAWNGEGLPPVGTECEVIEGKPLSVFDKWTPCKVIHFNCRDEKETQVCIIDDNGDFAILYSNDAFKFRPIHTEAERKRESAVNDLVETMIYFYGNPKGAESYKSLAERIFDAVAIGKIPGLRLSDD